MITSSRNNRVAAAKKLRRTRVRRQMGNTLVEGPFLLEEAAAAAAQIQEVFALEEDAATARICKEQGCSLLRVTPQVMGALASSVNPRGPVAVVSIPETPPLEPRDSVVLWDIADPGNAGTIIRTAGAFGFQVIATAGCVDLWSPKVIRSGVGGHFRAPPIVDLDPDPGVLIASGLTPLVAAAGASAPADEVVGIPVPVALIIGNEAHGVPGRVVDTPGVNVFSLPMPGGAESLNAAVAAGIAMYLRMNAR